MLFPHIFYAKTVHNKAETDGTSVMFPEPRIGFALVIAVLDEAFF